MGVWANVKANVLTGRGVITNCRSLYTFVGNCGSEDEESRRSACACEMENWRHV